MKYVQIGIKFPKNSEIKRDLNEIISYMNKNAKLELGIDTKSFTTSLKTMSSELDKLKSKLAKFNVLDNIVDDSRLMKSKKEIDDLANTIGKLNEKSQIKVKNNDRDAELKQAQAINKALDEQYSKQQSLNTLQDNLRYKLNISKENSFIDDGVITKLQSQLDSINTNTSEKEISELKMAINNLSSTDGSIVRVQNSIVKLQQRISNIKDNKIDIVDKNDIAELKQAESELSNLKNILSQLQGGEVIDGKKISSSINTATNSVRTLENSFKSANTVAGGLSNTVKNIFSYAIGGSLSYTLINGAKNSISTIKELDDSIRDLKRVTDETEQSYSKFIQTANQTAIALGSTTSGAIDATTTFSQLGYSFKESSEYLSRMALVLSNVGDMSASDSASSIVSILKGFRLEAEQTTRILDVLNESGNKFAITTGELTEGLRIGGASLATANNNLEESSALIISGTEILRNSNLVANGLKTISMRMRGVSEDGEELNASMGEFIKNMTGVDLTDANGEFRSTYDVLNDIGKVWDNLNSMQQASLAEEIAGKHRANVFVSIMQNAQQLEKAYDTLSNSAGSAEKEQQAYMDSISGKVNALKESLVGLSTDMVNSDFIKGLTDGATQGITVLRELINTFGGIPTTVALAGSAMSIFNKNFRDSISMFVGGIPKIGEWSASLSNTQAVYKSQIDKLKQNITTMQDYIVKQQSMGNSTEIFNKKLIGMQSELTVTSTKLAFATLKTIAFQMALSAGLGLAISAVITGATKLGKAIFNTSDAMAECRDNASQLSSTLDEINTNKDLVSQYEELNGKLKDTKVSQEEIKDLNSQISNIKSQLGANKDYYWILNDETKSLQEQIDLMKEIRDLKLKEQAEELEKEMPWQNTANNKASQLESDVKQWNAIKEAIANADATGKTYYNGQEVTVKGLNTSLATVEERIKRNSLFIEEWNGNLKLISQSNVDTSKTSIALSNSVNDVTDKIRSQTKELQENKKAKEENANTGIGSSESPSINVTSVEEATKSYGEAISKVQELDTLLQKVNETQAMTPDLIVQMSEKFPELGAKITDVTAVQELLNAKIQEQVEAQSQAYQIMIGDDEEYYNSKIRNNAGFKQIFNNFLNSFISDGESAYNVDLSNYKTLNELKQGAQNSFGSAVTSWLSRFIDVSANGYNIDLSNFRDLATAKAQILDALNQEIGKINRNMASSIEQYNSIVDKANASNGVDAVTGAGHQNSETGKLTSQLNGYKDKIQQLNGAIEQINTNFNNFGTSFDRFFGGSISSDIPTFGTGSSSGTGSGSGSGSGSSKEIEDIEIKIDRYRDLQIALDEVNEALEINNILSKNANSQDKIKYSQEEIKLLQDKKRALEDIQKEQKKELSELKKSLSDNGFKFKDDGTINNANNRLKEIQNWANSSSGSEKERRQGIAKNIQEVLNMYDELNKTISSTNSEILDMNNSIIDAQKEIADVIKEQYEEWKSSEEKKTQKLKDEIQKRKDIMNKEWDNEDKQDALDEEQKKLNELMSQRQDALRTGNEALINDLNRQIEEQRKAMNDLIRDNERDNANDKFDEEMKKLEDELESKLEAMDKEMLDEALLGKVQSGATSLSDIFGNINMASNDLNKNMLMVGDSIASWSDNLINFTNDLSKIPSTLGLNLGFTNSLSSLVRSANEGVNITSPLISLVVHGDFVEEVLPTVQNMIDDASQEIIKEINNGFKR